MASKSLAILAVLGLNACLLHAQMSTTLSPSKDNTIYVTPQGDPLSNGAGDRLFAGRTGNGILQRALIHFDLTGSIPANVTIERVELTLTRVMTASGGNGRTLNLHRLEKDWGEGDSVADMGQGGGSAPANGDATWEHTFFNTDRWDTPGGDLVSTSSASLQTSSGNDNLTFGSTTRMIADVQGWLDDPAGNFGWIVVGDESVDRTGNAFASSEAGSATSPNLLVEYSVSTNLRKVMVEAFEVTVWPNPSNQAFFFEFTLPERAAVGLVVYDLVGKPVYTRLPVDYPAGRRLIHWEGRQPDDIQSTPGFYFYELTIGAHRFSGRIMRAP